MRRMNESETAIMIHIAATIKLFIDYETFKNCDV